MVIKTLRSIIRKNTEGKVSEQYRIKKANQMAAIDLLIHNPEITKRELAKELKVTPQTIHGWFADDRFVDMYYKQYMVSFNAKVAYGFK